MPSAPAFSVLPLTVIASTVVFFVSVYVTLRVAQRLNLEDPRNTDAFLVTILKGAAALGGLFLAGMAPGWTIVIIPLVIMVVPVMLYQKIFAATLKEAAIMWIVVLAAESVSAVVLLAGARVAGTLLDQRFNVSDILETSP